MAISYCTIPLPCLQHENNWPTQFDSRQKPMEFLGCICAPADAQFFGGVVEIYDCAEGDEDDSDAQIRFGC